MSFSIKVNERKKQGEIIIDNEITSFDYIIRDGDVFINAPFEKYFFKQICKEIITRLKEDEFLPIFLSNYPYNEKVKTKR